VISSLSPRLVAEGPEGFSQAGEDDKFDDAPVAKEEINK